MFGLSDHLTVIARAGVREMSSYAKRKIIQARDKRPSKVASLGRNLIETEEISVEILSRQINRP